MPCFLTKQVGRLRLISLSDTPLYSSFSIDEKENHPPFIAFHPIDDEPKCPGWRCTPP